MRRRFVPAAEGLEVRKLCDGSFGELVRPIIGGLAYTPINEDGTPSDPPVTNEDLGTFYSTGTLNPGAPAYDPTQPGPGAADGPVENVPTYAQIWLAVPLPE
jgi:hypothetical protein